ncbi:PilC family type IV pilus tip adhesin [Neisseria cinerea]|uniref:PilC family type IV pilus tip adhesin n=1 Tax=Neisseria cinerea TaxID=483 RepID=UPI000D360F03|nr:PilC family type IV pilus tip adhesin [Neisseria cinerea]
MKQRHITKNRRRLTAVKPLAAGIFAALTASQSAQAIPFRDLPAYLQNTSTVSGTGKVRPNVVFLVDDSNFMNNGAGRTVIQHTFSDGKILIKVRDKNNNNAEIMRTLNPKNLMLDGGCPQITLADGRITEDPRYIDPSNGWCTKPLPPVSLQSIDPVAYQEFKELQIGDGNGGLKLTERLVKVKDALKAVVGKYGANANWGLQTLHNNGGSDTDGVNAAPSDMQSRIDRIKAQYPMVPLTRRYYETVRDRLLPAVKYRCQKSYVVVLTSSKSDTSCHYTNYVFGSSGYSDFAGNLGSYPKNIPATHPQHWKDCLISERKYQKRYPNMMTCPWEAYWDETAAKKQLKGAFPGNYCEAPVGPKLPKAPPATWQDARKEYEAKYGKCEKINQRPGPGYGQKYQDSDDCDARFFYNGDVQLHGMRVANYKLALGEYKKSKGFGANEESRRVHEELCPSGKPNKNGSQNSGLHEFFDKEKDHLRSLFGNLKYTQTNGLTAGEYGQMAAEVLDTIGLAEFAPQFRSTYRSLNGPRYCETENGTLKCKVRVTGRLPASISFNANGKNDEQTQFEGMRFPAVLKQSDSWRNNYYNYDWVSDYYYFNPGKPSAGKSEKEKFSNYFGEYFSEHGFDQNQADANGTTRPGMKHLPGAGQCTAGSVDTVLDGDNGMGMFSRALAEKDIKSASDGRDAAGVSWDSDASSDPAGVDFGKQTVQTYTVNFNADEGTVRKEYLRNGASRDNMYYPVTDYKNLTKILDEILGKIQSDTKNTTGGAFSATAPAATGNSIPDLAAAVFLNPTTWSSRLRFYRLDASGYPDKARYVEPSFDNRKTLIKLGNNVYFTDKMDGVSGIGNHTFGIPAKSGNADEWKELLLPWTDRSGNDKALETLSQTKVGGADKYSQKYRVRPDAERHLGDILDSQVVAVGNTDAGNHREFMVTAANDGMVHIFKRGSKAPYDLKLSYIPANIPREDETGNASDLAKTLKDFAHSGYGNHPAHTYGVNGGFVVRQADVDGQKRVFMFGAMGQGGRGAYALDIGAVNGSQDAWNVTVPLFDAVDKDMGYTVGMPQMGRTYNNKSGYSGFLAGGYHTDAVQSNANKTALYVYDMFGKTLIRRIDVPTGMGGLSSPTLVDTDFDGVVDVVYAGDRGGNMYRFNVVDSDPSKWNYSIVYRGNPSQPITAAPAVSRRESNKYVVIFGTGSDLTAADTVNQATQSVYGIFDDVSWDSKTGGPKTAPNARGNELVKQNVSKDNDLIFLTNNEIDEKTKKGWKIDLAPGERVTLKPNMILRTAVVTIRNYTKKTVMTGASSTGDLCIPDTQNSNTSTETTILAVNAEDGGGLTPRKTRLIPPAINNGGNNTANCKNIDGKIMCPNGYTFPGPLVPTYLDGKKIGDPPTSPDGDTGGSGNDDGPPDTVPNNKCFTSKGKRTLLMNNMSNLDVVGPLCGMKRISWREIFF